MVTNLIEKAIEEYWGMRCPKHVWGCTVCAAWDQYDNLTKDYEVSETEILKKIDNLIEMVRNLEVSDD